MSDVAAEVAALWQRARDSLKVAERLAEDGYPDFGVSRAYYAAFYAASALFAAEGKTFSTHSAVIAHVHRDCVKTGRMRPEVGRIINSLFELRALGDYGSVDHVDPALAKKGIAEAKLFLEAVRSLFPPDIRPQN